MAEALKLKQDMQNFKENFQQEIARVMQRTPLTIRPRKVKVDLDAMETDASTSNLPSPLVPQPVSCNVGGSAASVSTLHSLPRIPELVDRSVGDAAASSPSYEVEESNCLPSPLLPQSAGSGADADVDIEMEPAVVPQCADDVSIVADFEDLAASAAEEVSPESTNDQEQSSHASGVLEAERYN